MKKILFSLSVMIFGSIAIDAQSVSVNTDGSTADASSILDVKSTTKGMLVPRMTTAQRTAIISPANGLLVYDTDLKSFWYHNGTAWTNITASGGNGNFALPYDATLNLQGTALRIANTSTAIEGSSTNGNGVYGYSENGSGLNANSANGFGVLASSSQATAIRAFSSNTNPTIFATNSNATGVAISGNSSLHDAVLGTSAGTSKAGIRGEATGASGIGVFGTATATNGYGVRGVNTVGTGVSGFSNSGYGINASSNSGVGLRTSSTSGTALEVFGNLKIYGGNTTPASGAVLTSDALGNAHWENSRIAFRAYGISSALTNGVPNNEFDDEGPKKVEFASESYDLNNNFTPTGNNSSSSNSSTFVVPRNGIYHFDANVTTQSNQIIPIVTISASLVVSRNGIKSVLAGGLYSPNSSSAGPARVSTDVSLLAGDIIWLEFSQTNIFDATTHLLTMTTTNYISGRLVIPL